MAIVSTIICTFVAALVLASRGAIASLEITDAPSVRARQSTGAEPNCNPRFAPHVQVNRSHMNGMSSFQAWRATADSVDLRFYAFPSGYKDGDPWGASCTGWPLNFICMVRTVPIKPEAAAMQQEGIGPGMGKQPCTWEQASSLDDGTPHHCHVYLYNLQGGTYLRDTQYHAWCMACLGPNCSESQDNDVYPQPEYYNISNEQDLQAVKNAMDPAGNQTSLLHDVELSNGQTMRGYIMDDACKCYVKRTVTGFRWWEKGKWYPNMPYQRIRNRADMPLFLDNRGILELVLDDGLPFKTLVDDEEATHRQLCAQAMVACIALILYICWGMFRAQRFVPILHQTGLATLIGCAIGYYKMLVVGDRDYIEFSFELMSYVVLPIVIFAAGYNLNGKSFFRYANYITFYGFGGTIIFFFSCYYIFKTAYDYPSHGFETSKRGVTFEFDSKTCIVLAAVLSCCDTVAPLTLIDPIRLPILYAVVFGEAVLNDVVGVLLSAGLDSWKVVPNAIPLLFTVLQVSLGSFLIGFAFGIVISLFWAKCPSLQEGTLQPVLLMMLLNYTCYVFVEFMEYSSIFAIFVCAAVCSHYAHSWLSHEAQHFAKEACEMLSYLCEAALFVFFGFASATYLSDLDRFPISWKAALFCTCVLVIVRILVLSFLFTVGKVAKQCQAVSVPGYHVAVVELCGCVRGTVCYALILKYVHPFEYRTTQEQLLVSTILLVVNATTLIFGVLLPVAIRCLEASEERRAEKKGLEQQGEPRTAARQRVPSSRARSETGDSGDSTLRGRTFDEVARPPDFRRQGTGASTSSFANGPSTFVKTFQGTGDVSQRTSTPFRNVGISLPLMREVSNHRHLLVAVGDCLANFDRDRIQPWLRKRDHRKRVEILSKVREVRELRKHEQVSENDKDLGELETFIQRILTESMTQQITNKVKDIMGRQPRGESNHEKMEEIDQMMAEIDHTMEEVITSI